MIKEQILLIGGGGHCKSVIDVIEQENRFQIAGIIDNDLEIGEEVLGYKVIGHDKNLSELRKKHRHALVTVGQIQSSKIRIKLYNLLKSLEFELPVIVSPRAYISKHAKVSEGTVVMHDALVNANTKIGANCIINTKALIEHDAIVEDHCHISTGAIINGGTIIRKRTFFGSNATSKEYINVDGFIKAGSVIK